MVTLDWIGKHLSDGKDFKPLARRAMAALIGDVYYCDRVSGSDSEVGTTWDKATKTINAAMDLVTANNDDYILVKGAKTDDSSITNLVDVDMVHLIGKELSINPYYPKYGVLYRTHEEDEPVLEISASYTEVAGFGYVGLQSTDGNPEFANAEIADGANMCYFHNNYTWDRNPAYTANETGVLVHGAHFIVLENNVFHSLNGNMDNGIVFGGATGNPAYTIINRCRFLGGSGAYLMANGIREVNGTWQNFEITNCTFRSQVTNAVRLGDQSNHKGIAHHLYGNMNKDVIFIGSGTPPTTHTLNYSGLGVASSNCYGANGAMADS